MSRKMRLSVPRKNEERKRLANKRALQLSEQLTHSTILPLQILHSSVSLPSGSWTDQSTPSTVCLCKISSLPTTARNVTHCISVAEDLTWTLHVHGHVVHNCAALSTIPEKLCTASLNSLLGLVEELHVCAGHPDAHFRQMAEARKGKFISSDGGTAAVLDTYSPVQLNGTTYTQTIRTTKCELLSPAPKCFTCVAYRPTLRATYHRLQNKKCRPIYQSPTTSHVNDRFLTTPECNGKMKRLRGRLNAAEKNVQSMK